MNPLEMPKDILIEKLLQFTASRRGSVFFTQEQKQEFIDLYTTYISRALGE